MEPRLKLASGWETYNRTVTLTCTYNQSTSVTFVHVNSRSPIYGYTYRIASGQSNLT